MEETEIVEFTLERDGKLPLRFEGTLICKYKARNGNTYTLYMTKEDVLDAVFVIQKQEDNYTNGLCYTVITFWEADNARTYFINELGAYESLCFQKVLGFEDVEILE